MLNIALLLMDVLLDPSDFLSEVLNAFLERYYLAWVINDHKRVLFLALSSLGYCGVQKNNWSFLFDLFEENVNLLIFLFRSPFKKFDIAIDFCYFFLIVLLQFQKLSLVAVHSFPCNFSCHLRSLLLKNIPQSVVLNVNLLIRKDRNRLSYRLLLSIVSFEGSFEFLEYFFVGWSDLIELEGSRVLAKIRCTRKRRLCSLARWMVGDTLALVLGLWFCIN